MSGATDSAFCDPLRQWLVLYVITRHEKAVARQLSELCFDHYVPLYTTVRRWKDRRVHVTFPMFASYVFARCAAAERHRVLGISGVVRCVSRQGAPVVIPDAEFATLRSLLETRRAEPYPYFEAGKRVRLQGGAFDGLEGRYIRRKGKHRAIIQLDHIMRAFVVDVDEADLRAVS
jgi:transcription antitermination factor NusG